MSLTKVSTPAIKDEAITLAKLLHGDSNNNGKFLRANNGADPSYETIDLTSLSASNLTSGTLPDARFPATLPAASAANLTNIPAANITGALPAIDGSNLTGVAAGGATNIAFNSGNGISFAATGDGSGSMSQELLDDYEEGTWTPTVTSSNISFSSIQASYVKIGSVVHLWLRLGGAGSQSGTGQVTIGGLPYTNNSATNPVGMAQFYKINFEYGGTTFSQTYIAGQSLQWLRNVSGGGSGAYLSADKWNNGAAVITQISYHTNS